MAASRREDAELIVCPVCHVDLAACTRLTALELDHPLPFPSAAVIEFVRQQRDVGRAGV